MGARGSAVGRKFRRERSNGGRTYDRDFGR